MCNISCGFSLGIQPPFTLLSTLAVWKQKTSPWPQTHKEPTGLHKPGPSPGPAVQVSTGQSPVSPEWSRPTPTHTAPREGSTDSSTCNTAPARHMQWFSTVNMLVWPCLMLFICVWAHISLTHPLPATHTVLQARLTMLLYMSHSSLLKTGFLSYFKVTQKTCNLFLHNNSRWISWSESYQLLTTPSYWSIKQPLSQLMEMLS